MIGSIDLECEPAESDTRRRLDSTIDYRFELDLDMKWAVDAPSEASDWDYQENRWEPATNNQESGWNRQLNSNQWSGRKLVI